MTDKLPARRPGSWKQVKYMPSEINRLADLILSTDRSNLRAITLELLFNFVALTEETLLRLITERVEISDRRRSFAKQLQRYTKDGLIMLLPYDVLKRASRAGLPQPSDGKLRAYRLGPVGEEYARRKGWGEGAPLSTPAEDRIAHDLICAEAMLRMQALWLTSANPGKVEVLGPRQVSIWDAEKKAFLVAPDGLLIKRKMDGQFERAFVVEYHNRNARLHVQQKLKKYEEVMRTSPWIWEDYWEISEMPWILVLHRQEATLRRYEEEVARAERNARYAAASLEDVWAGKLSITAID